MKTSEALMATKERLWDGQGEYPPPRTDLDPFICIAADRALVKHIVEPIVLAGLAPEYTFNAWIYTKWRRLNDCELQLCRHAWLDKLIADYESRND